MKLKKFYKYRLVILLAVIVGIMGVTKIRYRDVKWEESVALITPTVFPTQAPKINENYPLWELLPYSGDNFIVDRYVEPNVLAIKTNEKIELIEEEVYKWMRENKVATESHKLIFEEK